MIWSQYLANFEGKDSQIPYRKMMWIKWQLRSKVDIGPRLQELRHPSADVQYTQVRHRHGPVSNFLKTSNLFIVDKTTVQFMKKYKAVLLEAYIIKHELCRDYIITIMYG